MGYARSYAQPPKRVFPLPASSRPKPAKPYPDFPLYAHAAGVWAKKIRQKLYYFGPWDNPDAALRKYLAEKDYLQAGMTPPTDMAGTTLKELVNRFLSAKQARVTSGELKPATWNDYKRTCSILVDHFGGHRVAGSIGPADFTAIREIITQRFAPSIACREIVSVRSVMRWGYDQELIPSPRFGSEFKKPSKKVLRQRRQQAPPMLYTPAEVQAMLGIADVHTRAWILLSVNAAFINQDVADLPHTAVDLHAGFVEFPRGKTAVERRCPLWPETVEALRASKTKRRRINPDPYPKQFFITREGNLLVRFNAEKAARTDAIHNAMYRIQKKLGIKRPRRGFAAFRHTFRTAADEIYDTPAILHIMGHADGTISDHYRECISDTRLVAVTEHVREQLLASQKTP